MPTHLPSIRFNDYLRAKAMTAGLEQRARLHRMDADGSERYSRCENPWCMSGLPARDRRTR